MNSYDPNYIQKKHPFLLGVKVLIINEKEEVLLLWRSDKVSRAHGIDLPGGGVDTGESPDVAAAREVVEEAGIIIDSPRIVGTFYEKSGEDDVVVLGYVARLQGEVPTVTLSWEHEAYEWRALADIDANQLPPLHASLFKWL